MENNHVSSLMVAAMYIDICKHEHERLGVADATRKHSKKLVQSRLCLASRLANQLGFFNLFHTLIGTLVTLAHQKAKIVVTLTLSGKIGFIVNDRDILLRTAG